MINVKDFLKALKHCVMRNTRYSNRFPFNCGYIHADKSLSFDCIGLVKSLINSNCKIATQNSPVGYYVTPGQVVPDAFGEYDILTACQGVTWGDFRNMTPGEYLYMNGHAGVYVGDLFGKNSKVNVIECTAAWGGGVVASWVDPDGTRKDWKPGTPCGKWEAHGKLTKWIEYDKKDTKKKSLAAIAREVIAGKWGNYPERKKKLEKAGYNYEKVQAKVNELLKK